MVLYNFIIGADGLIPQTAISCNTDGEGHVISCETSETSGKKGSLDVNISTNSQTGSGTDPYTLCNLIDIYDQIIKSIADNELNIFVLPDFIDPDSLILGVLEDIDNIMYTISEPSDNLSGFSDSASSSSHGCGCKVTIDDVTDNYQDVLAAIQNTKNYL